MIRTLNALVDRIEEGIDGGDDIDIAALAREHATTEYHLRRMFAALASMPVSEYVRRRRMTLAAGDLARGDDDVLTIAVRYGYGSTEAFGRAFRAVHGTSPGAARRDGGPLRTQPILRFRLTIEGNTPMDVTITDRPTFILAGHAAAVPLLYEGVNPHIQEHIASIAPDEHGRLTSLSDTEPAGILAVTDDLEPGAPEGAMLTYLHGVAVTPETEVPADLATIVVVAGTWAVFHSDGPHPETLQRTWAATATDWFPSNPWRLRPGPSIVRYLELTGTSARCELWLPIESAS